MSRTRFLHSLSGNAAEKFPPAGGMGDWGLPQQARLSYKCYACASESEPSMGVFRFMPTEISSEIVISLYEGLFWNCNKIVISLLTLQNADGIKADDQLLNF